MPAYQTMPYGNYNYVNPQPVNSLIRIDSIEECKAYSLPPNSVSPPMFLSSDNIFLIKTTDEFGVFTIKRYSFEEYPFEEETTVNEYVTREYLDSCMNQLMEAINGKHTVQEQHTETKSK